jgi:ferredoxin
MPELEVEGVGTFDVEDSRRLVLAIEEDAVVDIMHQCGSYAHCATCRVEFLEGASRRT